MAKHIPQFYASEIDEFYDTINIEDMKVVNHLKVLRRGSEDQLWLANGRGYKRLYSIIGIDKKSVVGKAVSDTEYKPPVSNIALLQAITEKNALSEIITKATELGVAEIVLFYSEYSQKYPVNKDKMLSEAIAAFEQSHSYHIPAFTYLANIKQATNNKRYIIVADTRDDTLNLKNEQIEQQIGIMIGPEGGWSDTERELLSSYPVMNLSGNILRAPTAATVAVGVLYYLMTKKDPI